MIPSWAKSGAKVICVNAKNWKFTYPRNEQRANLPKEGRTYTIRDVCGVGEAGLRLEGLDNSHIPTITGFEFNFRLTRFRPLIAEADDIALFKSLLNPTLVDKLDLLAERLDHIYNE